jgi:hypothetical protein
VVIAHLLNADSAATHVVSVSHAAVTAPQYVQAQTAHVSAGSAKHTPESPIGWPVIPALPPAPPPPPTADPPAAPPAAVDPPVPLLEPPLLQAIAATLHAAATRKIRQPIDLTSQT